MLTKPYRLVIGTIGCLLLLALSARAQGPTTFESDTVSSAAAKLQATTTTLPIGGLATQCTATVETAGIRYRIDGGTPTATTGLPANPHDIIQLGNPLDIANFSFIAQTAVSALMNVSCGGGTVPGPSSRIQGVFPTTLLSGNAATLANVGDTASINAGGVFGVGVAFQPGTFVGTVGADCSMTGGASWVLTYFDQVTSNIVASLTLNAPAAVTQFSLVGVSGCDLYRVRVLTAATGSISATLRASTPGDPSVLFTAPPAASAPPYVAVVGGVDSASLARGLAVTPTGVALVQAQSIPGLPWPQSCNVLVKTNCH